MERRESQYFLLLDINWSMMSSLLLCEEGGELKIVADKRCPIRFFREGRVIDESAMSGEIGSLLTDAARYAPEITLVKEVYLSLNGPLFRSLTRETHARLSSGKHLFTSVDRDEFIEEAMRLPGKLELEAIDCLPLSFKLDLSEKVSDIIGRQAEELVEMSASIIGVKESWASRLRDMVEKTGFSLSKIYCGSMINFLSIAGSFESQQNNLCFDLGTSTSTAYLQFSDGNRLVRSYDFGLSFLFKELQTQLNLEKEAVLKMPQWLCSCELSQREEKEYSFESLSNETEERVSIPLGEISQVVREVVLDRFELVMEDLVKEIGDQKISRIFLGGLCSKIGAVGDWLRYVDANREYHFIEAKVERDGILEGFSPTEEPTIFGLVHQVRRERGAGESVTKQEREEKGAAIKESSLKTKKRGGGKSKDKSGEGGSNRLLPRLPTHLLTEKIEKIELPQWLKRILKEII